METDKRGLSVIRRLVNSACALVLAASTISAQAITGGGKDVQSTGPPNLQDDTKTKSAKPSPKLTPVLWPPPDVDAAIPPITPEGSCPVEEVLRAAGQRVQELGANLERFTADENIDSGEIGKDGRLKRPLRYSFKYQATLSQNHDGLPIIDEHRIETGRISPIPMPVSTIGLVTGAA